MSESQESSQKHIQENADSVFPNMELKTLGAQHKQASSKSNRISNISSGDAVQEEEVIDEETNDKDVQVQKIKFKHVNILTDSTEFQPPLSSPKKNQEQFETFQEDSIQERGIEEEDQEQSNQTSGMKLSISNHQIHEAIILDKREFECNISAQHQSKLKKASQGGPSSGYSQLAQEEIIVEDPEVEEIPNSEQVKLTSHKDIKIKVDEVDEMDQTKQSYLPKSNYMDTSCPTIEEIKEEDQNEATKDHASKFAIKKLVLNDNLGQIVEEDMKKEQKLFEQIIKGEDVQDKNENEQLNHQQFLNEQQISQIVENTEEQEDQKD